ncbi:MAG: hypothetical protein RMJ51_03485 [Candidatus Calescibacterium sp.]|nr:YfhO family protein [Candidatus Calescibacterium sp.]MDW8195288.1 hypothetical protein [Candidatus Calescibacterium sp.]
MIKKAYERVKSLNIDVFLFYVLLVWIFFYPVGDHIIGSADSYNQFLPLRVFYSHALKEGEIPLWYPYQALGLPFLGIVQTGALYPINLILYRFLDPYFAYNLNIYIHFVLAQFFAFLYADYVYRKVGLGRVYAFLSGFIYGLSGFAISHVDYVPLQNSVPYLPLALLFVNKIVDDWKDFGSGFKRNFVWIWGLSVCLGYQFLAGYPQIFLYTLIFLLVFILLYNWRLIWILFLALVLSIPIIFVFAFEVWNLSSISIRSYISFETYNQGSLPLYAFLIQVVPFIFGGSAVNPHYYGPSTGTISFEFIAYISFIALPLTVFAYVKIFSSQYLRKELARLGVLGIVVLILALGKYNLVLHYLIFDLPFYSKVRVVARHLLEFSLIQSLFIPLAIHLVLSNSRELLRFIKVCFYTYVSITVISVWFFVNPEVGRNLSKLTIDRYDLYVPITLGLISFSIIVFYHIFRRAFTFMGIGVNQIILLIFFVFFLDSWFVFYNISPSYVSGWWGKRHNIESYLEYMDKLDKNYRICYMSGFPLLFPGVVGLSMLNYYEPVIPFDFVRFFKIWMNGSFITPNDYFLLVNNSVLSAFSVKYIFINPKFNQDYGKHISIKSLKAFDYNSLGYGYFDFRDVRSYKDYQKVEFDFVNNLIFLSSGSKVSVNFRNRILNRMILVCFKAKVSKMNFVYKYRRLVFNITDGLGIEIKNSNGYSLSYYFLNDYYLNSKEWVYCVVPFILDLPEGNDAIGLTLHIYPVNSFGRTYELKDLEIFSFALMVPNFVDKAIKRAYIYSDRFMDNEVYINHQALPLVFSPKKVIFCKNIDEVKYYFGTLKFNPLDTVMVMEEDKKFLNGIGLYPAEVKMVKRSRSYFELEYSSNGDSIIVLNDMYYRGWKAEVNNQGIPIFRVNGFSKGVVVKKGKGKIRFYYEPLPGWLLILNVMFIYLYLIIFMLFFLRLRSVLRNILQKGC